MTSQMSALGTPLSKLEPSITEALIQMVSGETHEHTDEIRAEAGAAVCFVLMNTPDNLKHVCVIRRADLPSGDPEPALIVQHTSIHIRQLIERAKPITVGIGWPVMETETKGVIYLLCRNIWNESSVQAFNLDVDNGVIFEPAKLDNFATRFLAEFLKLFMAWSALSQFRDLPGINDWAQECIAAEDDDPCPCGSKLEYHQCCEGYEFNQAALS
jgi:hypothetical protein